MILVSYDISDNKLRNKFSKFLSKFGYRLQYSVFQIDNSERILNIVADEIENRFLSKFSQCDSVYLFKLSASCKIMKYGYAKNEDESIIIC